jgi:DNA-directed RNA polymerase subunit RPC12/RpoP
MSEYKYACPVCGQHMMCDSSQAGSVMECPTCFQKIIAPQAPSGDDQKFVLTGTKVGERPAPKIPTAGFTAGSGGKNSSLGTIVVIVVIIGLLGAGAAVFAFRGTIFKSGAAPVADDPNQSSVKNQPPPKPVLVAPPASDTNWTLNLDEVTNFPDGPVAGRIHAIDFIMERSYFQNGILTLRAAGHGPLEFGCTVNFGGAQAEALAGQTINVSTNADTAARITLHWKSDTDSGKDNFESGYAMHLEFGALANNRLPGKIYLCIPDNEKSYLMGNFNADTHKPKPKTPKK